MPNVLIVTLDNDANPTCLNVADTQGSPNQVKRHADWQTIRWELQVNDSKAAFNSQKQEEPGFAWKSNPPAGVFSEPRLRKHGKVLIIADLNDYDKSISDSTDTTGEWIYQLSATIHHATYQSKVVRTTTNPRIKNT